MRRGVSMESPSMKLDPTNLIAEIESLLDAPGELLDRFVDSIDDSIEEQMDADPFQRDPRLVAAVLPLLRAVNAYFGSEVRGWRNLPERGPFLVVGNHSGGAMTMDPMPFMQRWIETRGADAPLYGLAYNLLFAYPFVGRLLPRLGILPASQENARHALARKAPVMVFPGGDYEVFRPWSERNRIRFGGRKGFVELALSLGIPVVPMTIHGAHESTVVLTRGHHLAVEAGFERLKVKTFPFIWNIPFGPTPGFIPSLPLPSKVTVEIGAPLDWSRHSGPEASDPEVVQACYDEITKLMQETLDRLAAQRPFPILSRLNELRPSKILRRGLLRTRFFS